MPSATSTKVSFLRSLRCKWEHWKFLKFLNGLGNKRVATTLKRRKVDRCPTDACLQKKKDCLFLWRIKKWQIDQQRRILAPWKMSECWKSNSKKHLWKRSPGANKMLFWKKKTVYGKKHLERNPPVKKSQPNFFDRPTHHFIPLLKQGHSFSQPCTLIRNQVWQP